MGKLPALPPRSLDAVDVRCAIFLWSGVISDRPSRWDSIEQGIRCGNRGDRGRSLWRVGGSTGAAFWLALRPAWPGAGAGSHLSRARLRHFGPGAGYAERDPVL